ncbi:GspE/PulE family protein [Candidatus Ruminimicrobiellum ovillum]|uniref:GspE/PulE family protein n=2 Tax=Candidatus Ruminimicrobiellum ovillum TaxID=1947927 RepID=UPI00355A8E9F
MVLEVLRKKYLGEVLLSKQYVTKEQLSECLKESLEKKKKIGSILLEKQYISEPQLLECLAVALGVEYRELSEVDVEQRVLDLIQEKIARKYCAVPLELNGDMLVVAMADPANVVYKDELARITNKKLSVILASEKDILSFIERFYVRSSLSKEIGENEIQEAEEEEELTDDIEESDSAPVIKYVNSIFFDAITKKASDIHLEPFEKEIYLRMRIDGILQQMPAPSKKYYPAIVSRIKIMSDLDIAERRLPQDGKCRIKISDQKIDIRVSIIPTIWGEKIVLRVLAKNVFGLDIERVGFSPQELAFFKEAITAPYGMILVTGPTSSGKTTTLYSALGHINTADINIMTAEDPVEYELKGINQCHVRADIGLDFARILRTFMRQDPDVILVGEIRDTETAQIAIQAALTGHLVFSTLHTNDTVSTISRMAFMGVESYLMADALNLIIAQRLVRTICPNCKKEVTLPDEIYQKLELDKSCKVYEGQGCKFCDNTGYKGRTAIFEMLRITKDLKDAIARGATDVELRDLAAKQGIISLRKAAIAKLLEGRTTVEEVFNVSMAEK